MTRPRRDKNDESPRGGGNSHRGKRWRKEKRKPEREKLKSSENIDSTAQTHTSLMPWKKCRIDEGSTLQQMY